MGALQHDILELLGGGPLPSGNPPAPTGFRVPVGAGREFTIAGEAHEGASVIDREVAFWSPSRRSADQDILPEKARADARVRDTLRNDAYVLGGANLRKDNIVGAYFMLNAKPSSTVLFGKEDSDWEDEFQEEVEEKFALYAESIDNWMDASRQNTFTELIRMGVGIHTATGEVAASVEWLRDSGRPFSTAIQMVDVDRLSTPPDQVGDPDVRGGVRRNLFGAPQGYYVRMAHPTDWMSPNAYKWIYVPIRKPWGRLQFIHIFEQLRPDQTRGIAQVVAALKEMRQTKKFRETVLQNAVLNASFAASIESDLPSQAVFEQLGGGAGDITAGQALGNYAEAYLTQIDEYAGGARNLQIDGVKIPHLFPGTKLNLRPAGPGGPLGTDFEQSLLRYIAASLDVSYEQLSRDYTKTNYSSARAAMTETWKAMQSRKKTVADRMASNGYRLWFEEALNAGEITSLPRRAPSFYEGQNKDAYTACDWTGASRGQIDELKETQAAILRINNGLSDLETENARLGADWRKRLRQIKREQGWKKEYGVLQDPTDTTNQMNAASGTPTEGNENG